MRKESRAQLVAEDEAKPLEGTITPNKSEMDYEEHGMISVSFS